MKKILILPYHFPAELIRGPVTSESILEELIDLLLVYPVLRVSSKSTSHYLSKNPLPTDFLKEKYDIDFVVEGGIKAAENKFSISTRLLSTKDESVLLRIKHTFQEGQLTATLEDISSAIYQKTTGTQSPPAEPETRTKSKAEQAYLTGLSHWSRYTHEELKLAIKYFKNALRYDGSFVLAYAALADCYCVMGVMGFEEPKRAFLTAKSFVQKAFELNNKRSEIFVSAALVDMFLDRDYRQAKVNLSQALLLNKLSLKAHHTFAMYYLHTNDLAAAEKHALFNVRNAPLDIPHYDMIAKIYLYRKEFEKGMGYVQKALQIDPESIEIKELEGHLNMHLGNYEKAIECYQICRFQKPDNPLYYSNLAYVFSKSNYHLDSRKVIDDMLELKPKVNNASTFHFAQSIINLGQQNYNDFFEQINIALENGLGMFVGEIICNPIYNEVRKDQRFKLILERLNLNLLQEEKIKQNLPASSITFSTKTKEIFTIDPQFLAYIESQGNYSKVYWFEQNILKNRLLRAPLSSLEQQLSHLSYIHRCHKSYIINTNEPLTISGNTKGYFFESNYYPIRIPISRAKSSRFLDNKKP